MKVLFLGKFQPPHLGHIQTIKKIAKDYSKVTVGITKGTPKVLKYENVKEIFVNIFDSTNNINVELIDGTIEDETSNLDKLDFDIILSGNHKVIELLKAKGYLTKFYERSQGIGYSSSELRSLKNINIDLVPESRKNSYDLEIVPTSSLKPLEKILPSHLKNLENLILKDQIMKKPIIVDGEYNVVLDGSHRYAFLIKHGYKFAPIIKVNYNDESIFVGNHLKHRYIQDRSLIISKSEVLTRGLSENLYPARTTRHFFPFRKEDLPVSLNTLKKGTNQDITYLIEDTDITSEIKKDLNYINEIDEELEILKVYIKEQNDVKDYLKIQIDAMKKIS
jgi:nicotinamide mononucleotide adenylyltransferase